MSNDEMMEGYRDGLNRDAPDPSGNRSYSYRHGFRNGRDDLNRKPRATAAELRVMATEAEELDRTGASPGFDPSTDYMEAPAHE